MTTEKALVKYNQLSNCSFKIEDLKYCGQANNAVEALVDISEIIEKAGGKLQSQQVMAAIIYFAEKEYKHEKLN